MKNIDRMLNDEKVTTITKKERLTLTREHAKLNRVLGGISNLNRLPSAIFIVDTTHEHIAVKEAHKLGMRTFGMVDTNSDPGQVDFPIPANDDASKSIAVIVDYLTEAIKEGLEDRSKQQPEKAKAAA
jgi:small subunit ribosomal protein S2